MEITVEQYNQSLESTWDTFIDNNNRNATFLHSRKFFNHNPQNQKDDASLLFYKNGKLKAVLPACLLEINGLLTFFSHPRSTYGGFIVDDSIGVEEAIAIVEETINFARSKNAEEIIIRNPFRIFYQLPSDETDYAMWFHGFSIKSRELECAIKLCADPESRYEDGTKRSVKKALKSAVFVRETDDYELFWQHLSANLSEKHGAKPTHTLEQFDQLKNQVSEDKIKLIGAFIDEKLVGGIVLFISKPTVLHAQYIASDLNHQNSRPLNAVIDYILKWGWEQGFSYLNLGSANEEAGRKINFGLFRFKEGFGGRGVLRETMHLKLNKPEINSTTETQ